LQGCWSQTVRHVAREGAKEGARARRELLHLQRVCWEGVKQKEKLKRFWKAPIGTDEMSQDLVAWLCHEDDLWHSQAHHLAGE